MRRRLFISAPPDLSLPPHRVKRRQGAICAKPPMDHTKICKLRDLYRAISALERRFERLYDLNINEVMLLCILRESGCMTSSELAEQLDLTPSNASKVIASVERLGFVSRTRCKQDKRQMYFSLTAAGGERLAAMQCEEIDLSAFQF